MSDGPPDGSREIETVQEALVAANAFGDILVVLRGGYYEIERYSNNLASTYDEVLGEGSAKSGKCETVSWVASEATNQVTRLVEMNDNLLNRLTALITD